MISEKWMSWEQATGEMKYWFPFYQESSNSTRHSTKSGLFLSCGSTTSIFSSYLRNSYLRSLNAFLILLASYLTALDCVEDIRLLILSADRRMSRLRSSLPFPSGFATEFIFPQIVMSSSLVLLNSLDSNKILPLALSLISSDLSSFSILIALVMKRRASDSISISCSTYCCSKFTQLWSNCCSA